MKIGTSIVAACLYLAWPAVRAADISIQVLAGESRGGYSTIFGNVDQNVELCMSYGLGNPIPGVTFYFWNYSNGYVTMNGMNSGSYTPPTGANGCVTVEISSWGIQPTPPSGSPDDYIRFSTLFQGQTYETDFHFVYHDPTLSLSDYTVDNVPDQIIVSIFPPARGINIICTCQGSGGAQPTCDSMVSTNVAGKATFTINGSGFEIIVPGGPQPSASCTFQTQTGGIHTATLEIRAVNICTLGLSPADPRCG